MRLPDLFYTLLVPARCKNKSFIFNRGRPVRPPAARKMIPARIFFCIVLVYTKLNHPILLRPPRLVLNAFWHRLPVRRCTWGLLLPLVLRWWLKRNYRQRSKISKSNDSDMGQVWTKTLPELKALIIRERGTLLCIWTRSDCRQAIGHHRFLAFSVQMDSFVSIKISCEFLTCIRQYFW